MKLKILVLLQFAVFLCAFARAEDQPPYEVTDPAINENFRRIYQLLDVHRHNLDDSSRPFDWIPDTGAAYDLGKSSRTWRVLYVGQISSMSNTASLEFTSTTIRGSGGGAYSLTVTTRGTDYHVAVTTWGTVSFNGSSPTVSDCGAAPAGACVACTNMAGTIAVGGGVVTACTLTFSPTWKTAPGNPTCVVSDNAAAISAAVTAISNTAVTFGTSATIAGGRLYYHCFGVRE